MSVEQVENVDIEKTQSNSDVELIEMGTKPIKRRKISKSKKIIKCRCATNIPEIDIPKLEESVEEVAKIRKVRTEGCYDKDGKFSGRLYKIKYKKELNDKRISKTQVCTCGLTIKGYYMRQHLKTKNHARIVALMKEKVTQPVETYVTINTN